MDQINANVKFLSKDNNDSLNFIVLDKSLVKMFIETNDKIRNKYKAYSPINYKKDAIFIKVKDVLNTKLIKKAHYNLTMYLSKRKKGDKLYFNLILDKIEKLNAINKVNIQDL